MKNLDKWLSVGAVSVACFAMFSCTNVPKTQSEAKQKMEDCGYTVETMTADDVSDAFGNGLDIGAKTAISCEKATEEQLLLAIWFNSEENAEDFKTLFKMMEGSLSEELGEDVKTKYEVEGEVFYYGTEQACEDFLG